MPRDLAATFPFLRWVCRPVAPASWDSLLRISGAVALAGILLTAFAPPISDLAGFFSLTLLMNGPYAGFLPTAYEPVVMVFARVHPPLVVALVGAVGATMVDYVNYRLYGAALHSDTLRSLKERALAGRIIRWFRAQPVLTIIVCAVTPLPFWPARAAAVLANYPVRPYLLSSAAGRFARLTFYALVGVAIPVSSGTILGAGAILTVALVAFTLYVGRARRDSTLQEAHPRRRSLSNLRRDWWLGGPSRGMHA